VFSPKNIFFYLFAFAIIAVSFSLYAPMYTLHYTSDHAVHVLMAHQMEFPLDLYYWGQNRLGSFLPFLAFLLKSISGFNALTSIAVVQYGLLTAGAFILARYIRAYILKCAFFLFLFFPTAIMPELLYIAQPYSTQFFFTALAIFTAEYYFKGGKARLAFLFISFLLLGLSVWGSELSGLFLVLFAGVLFMVELTKPVTSKARWKNAGLFAAVFIAAGACTYAFISYAKANSVGQTYERAFTGLKEFGEGVMKHLEFLGYVLSHPGEDFYSVIHISVFIFLLGWLIYELIRSSRSILHTHKAAMLLVFFLNGVLSWLILYITYWAHRNNFEFRYWVFSYISIGAFLFWQADEVFAKRKVLLTVALILFCASQVFLSLRHAENKDGLAGNEMPLSELQDVKKLGSCGILGNYWFTYNLASANPSEIIAAPREGEFIRNLRQLPALFAKSEIYMVRNDWMETFPDSVVQYGVTLRKSAEPFQIRNAEICAYQKGKYRNTFTRRQLSSRNAEVLADSTSLHINNENKEFGDFVVFGPFTLMNAGTYRIKFHINNTDSLNDGLLKFDISSGWGGRVYAVREVKSRDLKGKAVVEIKANISNLINGVEFRIFLKGKNSFVFEKVEVVQE